MNKKFDKLYLSYSPVINILAIIIVDIISLISYEFYYKYYVYISIGVGMSVLNAADKRAMARLLPYCSISKFAVYALISFIPIFIIDYWIFGYESKYNRILQIAIGVVALLLTLKVYIKKYPSKNNRILQILKGVVALVLKLKAYIKKTAQ
jgi:hypothetical protein